MGLDNIPKKYPCKEQGTAVLDAGGLIDCEQTKFCGGCVWYNDYTESKLDAEPIYGIFGTSCWYRGKYGNWLLEAIGVDEPSFYGDDEEASEKTPEACKTLAEIIGTHLSDGEPKMMNEDDVTEDLKYAQWYLNWAAEKCDGLVCWW